MGAEPQCVENNQEAEPPESALSGRLITEDAQKDLQITEIPIIPTSPALPVSEDNGKSALHTNFQDPEEEAAHIRDLVERVISRADTYLEQFPLFSCLERLELSANPLYSAALLGGALCLFSGLRTLGLDGV